MSEVTKKVMVREQFMMTGRMTFNKAAQNDVVTIVEPVKYVEASAAVEMPIRGIERITVMVGGKSETYEYDTYTMTAAATATEGGKILTVAQADYNGLPQGVILQNRTTGEYIMVLGKKTSGSSYMLDVMRGLYGTTITAIASGQVFTIFNKVKLTSTNTGYGIIIYDEMPTPGEAQDFATNV